jgi:hypothetical protein
VRCRDRWAGDVAVLSPSVEGQEGRRMVRWSADPRGGVPGRARLKLDLGAGRTMALLNS